MREITNNGINNSFSTCFDNNSLIVYNQNIRGLKGKANGLTSALDPVQHTLYV